jgi:hypothetical protein
VKGLKLMFPLLKSVREETIIEGLGAEIIQWMTDHHGLDVNWFGRPLQLIDTQNVYCELSKYCRAIAPGTTAGSKRIKQRYSVPNGTVKRDPAPFFPPMWGLN